MTPLTFIALMALGHLIGLISSFFGVGGGAFLVPAMVVIAHLPRIEAIGLSLTQMVPMTALGAWRRWRQNEVDLRLALLALTGSVPGTWLGSRLIHSLEAIPSFTLAGFRIDPLDTFHTFAFTAFLVYMSAKTWKRARPAETVALRSAAPAADGQPSAPSSEAWLLGLMVGVTSALLGIGGGFIFVPIAIHRFGLPVAIAVGTSLFQMPFTASFAAFFHVSETPIPWIWLIPLLTGSLTGVVRGVSLSRRFSNRQYQRLLAIMLMVVVVIFLGGWIKNMIQSTLDERNVSVHSRGFSGPINVWSGDGAPSAKGRSSLGRTLRGEIESFESN